MDKPGDAVTKILCEMCKDEIPDGKTIECEVCGKENLGPCCINMYSHFCDNPYEKYDVLTPEED